MSDTGRGAAGTVAGYEVRAATKSADLLRPGYGHGFYRQCYCFKVSTRGSHVGSQLDEQGQYVELQTAGGAGHRDHTSGTRIRSTIEDLVGSLARRSHLGNRLSNDSHRMVTSSSSGPALMGSGRSL
jgi:hypothetical protein